MKSGGFAMKKWASNGPAALSDLPVEALWLTGIEWDDPLPAEINDAAEAAYKAVAHLLTQTSDGVPQVRFVLAKAGVTPIKRRSLLRVELMASLLAARLKAYITKETFTANRVQEIIRQIKPSQWRYVPAVDNPADRLSGEEVRETDPERRMIVVLTTTLPARGLQINQASVHSVSTRLSNMCSGHGPS
ncbi:hypothetical protein T4A_3040 [Trichinella pseudospiralis]|uniref:Uncharacterized protein n=1 Tax=Trichinella pseudospiralis TaxID=6337 RepID=A0A0V1DTY4_TRIPS|nr:hypothetical protein T4A_3040 [Trichinella pseudospiralis]